MRVIALSSLLLTGCISFYPKNTTVGICWDSQGQAHYPDGNYDTAEDADNQHCASEKFSWSKPVKLVYFDGVDNEVYRDSFDAAVEFWNDELDRTVFTSTDNPMKADITVSFGGNIENGEAATTRHARLNGAMTSTITVKAVGDTRQVYLYIAHELGHAGFGLAHDPNGIMYPFIVESEGDVTTGGPVMKFWPVLENDKDAIIAMLK